MNKPLKKTWGPKPGFSLIEIMVVVAILAILALMALPALIASVPAFEARSAAQTSSSLILMARRTAAATQKPARALIDCRSKVSPGDPIQTDPCELKLYSAVFNQRGELVNWDRKRDVTRVLADRVTIAATDTQPAPGSPDNVYWVVFLPSGAVKTSHEPMTLTITAKGAPRAWELTLDPATGQITTTRKAN